MAFESIDSHHIHTRVSLTHTSCLGSTLVNYSDIVHHYLIAFVGTFALQIKRCTWVIVVNITYNIQYMQCTALDAFYNTVRHVLVLRPEALPSRVR